MLVIISDLHLTDGTSGETIKAGAFRILKARLSDMAYDASWRSSTVYQPIESIDLILLGDVLDAIRSTRWLNEDVRPWDDFNRPDYVAQVGNITRKILEQNDEALAVLRGFNGNSPVTIPKATQANRPYKNAHTPKSSRRIEIPVRIHYLVGNHDWFYHLPGSSYDAIRQEIVQAMGLHNSPTAPFPHDPVESAELMSLYARYRVFARHGDIFDSFNYDGDRDASSLGDVVVLELINRFSQAVKERVADRLPPACLAGLKEIDNVRPNMLVPVWISSVLEYNLPPDDPRKGEIKTIWNQLVDRFFELPVVKNRDKWGFDDVDRLELVFKSSRWLSLETSSKIVTQLYEWGLDSKGSNHKNALDEQAFKDGSARFIVHGHTHHREVVALESKELSAGRRLDQFYMNSGTWRRVHELARFQPEHQKFLGYNEMTYFAFFKEDERKQRPFEMWSGSLGVPPLPVDQSASMDV